MAQESRQKSSSARKRGPSLIFMLATIALIAESLLAAQEPFDYFRNSWNVIGLKDYERGTRITPDNQLLLAGKDRVSIAVGNPPTPLSRRQTKTLLEGWLPVVLVTTSADDVRYEFMFWASPLPTAADWTRAFAWPTDGENYLNWIAIKATNTGTRKAPARIHLKRWTAKEDYVKVAESPPEKPEDILKRQTFAQDFSWTLNPGEVKEGHVNFPFFPIGSSDAFLKEDPNVWLKRTVDFWKTQMTGAAHISVPCRKATEAFLASHVCQLLALDRGEIHAGEGFYDVFYIRDGAYQVMEFEEAGLLEEARRALDAYLSHQRPDGRFESQRGQFDANGQAVWVLWQYYKITGDKKWLVDVYPRMRKSVDWTIAARRKTQAEQDFPGLLPAAPADGEYLWEGKNRIVGYDFWNLRAMLCTAEAARILGMNKEAKDLSREANDYRKAIDAAWKRTGLAYFPPSWEKDGTHWGNTEILWPTPILDPGDARIAALSTHVRKEYMGGYVEGIIRWGTPKLKAAIHPYMGAYTTMNDLCRSQDEQVVEDFYWYLLHSTAAHAFPEGVYYQEGTAWGETIPHATGASNYALLLRHMLVHESGDELHLLPAVPDWWLGEGKEIRIERAPTHFGVMSLIVRGTTSGVKVDFTPPQRERPKKIFLHLPKSRPLEWKAQDLKVVYRPDQKKRWDFETVVRLYNEKAPPLLKK
jgi:hypothetical protein